MDHPSSLARKVASTACLAYSKSSRNLKAVRRIMKRLVHEELLDQKDSSSKGRNFKKYLNEEAETVFKMLDPLLREDPKTLAAKRRAIRLAEQIPRQETADLLLGFISSAEDHGLRFLSARALTRLQDQNPKLLISRTAAKNEIAREARIYNNIRQLLAFHEARRKRRHDFLRIALEAVRDESFERLFFYLDLLYPHEIIQEIHQGIVNHGPQDPVHVHAAELLANTLEPDVLILMQSVLDPHRKFQTGTDEVWENLEGFMNSGDRWFSVIGFFFAEESGLSKKHFELDQLEEKLSLKTG